MRTAGARAAARPLVTDEHVLGLRCIVVETEVGPVVARVGDPGAGPGLVLVHGAAGSWTTWTPLLQEAAARGRPLGGVVALDLPGWGDSPAPRRALDPDGAAAVIAAVARAAGHDRWIVVGHSLGGFAALQLAALEPVATAGVVLVSPTGPAVVEAMRHPVAGGLRLPWFGGMLLAMRALRALPGQGAGLLRRLVRARLLPPLSRPLFADRTAVHPSVVAALAHEIRPEAFISAARAAASADLTTWRGIACPVRSLRGTRDVFVGRHDAEAFRALIPGFVEQVVEDAGHFAAVEHPEAVLAAIEAVRPRPHDGGNAQAPSRVW